MKKYIIDEEGNIIDKTKNTIIGQANGVFIPDDGITDIFYRYTTNLHYYSNACNISLSDALKIFGRVFD